MNKKILAIACMVPVSNQQGASLSVPQSPIIMSEIKKVRRYNPSSLFYIYNYNRAAIESVIQESIQLLKELGVMKESNEVIDQNIATLYSGVMVNAILTKIIPFLRKPGLKLSLDLYNSQEKVRKLFEELIDEAPLSYAEMNVIHEYIQGELFFLSLKELLVEFKGVINEDKQKSKKEKIKAFKALSESMAEQNSLKLTVYQYRRARLHEVFYALVEASDKDPEKLKALETVNQFFVDLLQHKDKVALLQGILQACQAYRRTVHQFLYDCRYPLISEN